MVFCKCSQYEDLDARPILNDRGHNTKKIIDSLELVAEHKEGEHKLYKCPHCGQLWQRSLDWVRGNQQYVYKVPDISIEDWSRKPFVQPDELFNRVAQIQQYLERAVFEEQEIKCKIENCSEYSIKFSVLCAYHHMISIGLKSEVDDLYTWFAPYLKENYEFKITQLKKLPNYKALL